MAKKEENLLFVGISGGNELRRDVLECSKGILETLKEHEKFKSLREEKIKLVRKFKDDVKGISRLISSLRGYLPKVKEVGIKKPVVKEERTKAVKVDVPKERNEIEKLEKELSEIESKLSSLG